MRILILGAGDVGTHLARVLSMVGEVVVMDRSPDALAQIEESLDVLTVKGDVTHRRSLLGVDAHKTELVVAVTGSDDTNLIGAALAAELGAERTVARVDDPNFYDSKAGIEEGILGVHAVLCASLLVGQELLRLIAAEDADATCILARGSLMLTALKLRGSEPVCGEKVSDLELPALTRIELVQRDGRALRPVEVARFEVGDELLVMGPPRRSHPGHTQDQRPSPQARHADWRWGRWHAAGQVAGTVGATRPNRGTLSTQGRTTRRRTAPRERDLGRRFVDRHAPR